MLFSVSTSMPISLAKRGDIRFSGRQEFVQRRVEQADGDRPAGHHAENARKIAPLHRQQLGQRGAALRRGAGDDHLAHGGDAVGLEEHVLGARQADALGAEAQRGLRVCGVSAFVRICRRRTWSAHSMTVPNSPLIDASTVGRLPI